MKKQQTDDHPSRLCLDAMLQQRILHNQLFHYYQHLPVIMKQAY